MTDTRLIRILYTVAPRMRTDDGRAVPTFINQALNNEPLTVFGDGRQTRSFGYITDLVDGVYRLMNSSEGEPVNVGNPQEMTVKEMAETIIAITGSKSRLIYKDLPEDDPKVRQPDVAKAKRTLGWEPKVDVKDGLVRTVEWFVAQHERERSRTH